MSVLFSKAALGTKGRTRQETSDYENVKRKEVEDLLVVLRKVHGRLGWIKEVALQVVDWDRHKLAVS